MHRSKWRHSPLQCWYLEFRKTQTLQSWQTSWSSIINCKIRRVILIQLLLRIFVYIWSLVAIIMMLFISMLLVMVLPQLLRILRLRLGLTHYDEPFFFKLLDLLLPELSSIGRRTWTIAFLLVFLFEFRLPFLVTRSVLLFLARRLPPFFPFSASCLSIRSLLSVICLWLQLLSCLMSLFDSLRKGHLLVDNGSGLRFNNNFRLFFCSHIFYLLRFRFSDDGSWLNNNWFRYRHRHYFRSYLLNNLLHCHFLLFFYFLIDDFLLDNSRLINSLSMLFNKCSQTFLKFSIISEILQNSRQSWNRLINRRVSPIPLL